MIETPVAMRAVELIAKNISSDRSNNHIWSLLVSGGAENLLQTPGAAVISSRETGCFATEHAAACCQS